MSNAFVSCLSTRKFGRALASWPTVAAKAGRRAPANNLLITACARHHGEIEFADAHFDFLKTL
jgi:hypothetical protein